MKKRHLAWEWDMERQQSRVDCLSDLKKLQKKYSLVSSTLQKIEQKEFSNFLMDWALKMASLL